MDKNNARAPKLNKKKKKKKGKKLELEEIKEEGPDPEMVEAVSPKDSEAVYSDESEPIVHEDDPLCIKAK